MPYFWDTTDTLPQPGLNPLTNPALERNISRWAQVYFSNPPGQREQAINKLLQEIKSETAEILTAERARRESPARSPETRSSEIRSPESGSVKVPSRNAPHVEGPDVRCAICQHQNSGRPRFCGQCGAALNTVGSDLKNGAASHATQTRVEAPSAESGSEVQWLRDRRFSSAYESEAPASQVWKYVLCLLVIALGGFAYLQWARIHPTGAASHVPANAPGMTTPALPRQAEKYSATSFQQPSGSIPSAPQAAAPRAIDSSTVEDQPTPAASAAPTGHDRQAVPAGTRPAVQVPSLLGTAPVPPTVESGDSGTADLRLAQRYLGGSMGTRDSYEGAKLLWKAVRQQDTTAAILLSDLYARGDGVPKSCDQARLLLVAAAKRGSPQAAEQLRALESRGCR